MAKGKGRNRTQRRAEERAVAQVQQIVAGEAPSGASPATTQRILRQMQAFQGPIPPPEMLAEYDRIMPGLAERLIGSLETQLEHRIDLEKRVTMSDIARADRGLWAGIVLALSFLLGAVVLGLSGREAAAAALAGFDIAGLLTATIYTTASRRSEREQKRR